MSGIWTKQITKVPSGVIVHYEDCWLTVHGDFDKAELATLIKELQELLPYAKEKEKRNDNFHSPQR